MNHSTSEQRWGVTHKQWLALEKELTDHDRVQEAFRLPWWKTWLLRKDKAEEQSLGLIIKILKAHFWQEHHHHIGKYVFAKFRLGITTEECFALERKLEDFLILKNTLTQLSFYSNKVHENDQSLLCFEEMKAWWDKEQNSKWYYQKIDRMSDQEFTEHLSRITTSILEKEELEKATPEVKAIVVSEVRRL